MNPSQKRVNSFAVVPEGTAVHGRLSMKIYTRLIICTSISFTATQKQPRFTVQQNSAP